jgi:hypothetical protein
MGITYFNIWTHLILIILTTAIISPYGINGLAFVIEKRRVLERERGT